VATNGKIRDGIAGANASRGFASIAHISVLRALRQFEIATVCTTRQETVEAAAPRHGAPLAFSDPADLAQHPPRFAAAVMRRRLLDAIMRPSETGQEQTV
jgi:predicted dehydrogenase